MKKRRLVWVMTLSLLFLCFFSLTGCGQTEDDEKMMDQLDEPEITVQYLSGEFADQLIRDGGEKILGTISITDAGDGDYEVMVHHMVIVESSITDEGFYIADKNLSTTVPLDSDARTTYIKDPKKGPQVMKLDKFIRQVQKDEAAKSADSDSEDEKLYDVYIIGGNALMLLAHALPDAS